MHVAGGGLAKKCAGNPNPRGADGGQSWHTAAMPNLAERLPDNALGKYYIDANCIDCDQCREAAPTLIGRNDDTGHSYVKRQPSTPLDLELIAEVKDLCPCQAIGDDGA
jgi:ferredoxin